MEREGGGSKESRLFYSSVRERAKLSHARVKY
jgi:hypothetical protein